MTSDRKPSSKGEGKGSSSKREDGRRNNVPPKSGQISPGEIRNPHGRKGKAGAEKALTEEREREALHQLYEDLCNKIMPGSGDGLLEAVTKIFAEDVKEGLVKGDPKIRQNLKLQLEGAYAAREAREEEQLEQVLRSKEYWTREFKARRMMGHPPPDILPHPAHVQVSGNVISIVGPTTDGQRARWELLKYAIKFVAMVHAIIRAEHKANRTPETSHYQEKVFKLRAKLMRLRPKGWNWGEVIFTRGQIAIHIEVTLTPGQDGQMKEPIIKLTGRRPLKEPIISEDKIENVFSFEDCLTLLDEVGYHPDLLTFLDIIYPDPPRPKRAA